VGTEVDQILEKRINLQVIFDQIIDDPKLSIKILGNLVKNYCVCCV
jgi:hypothetical protein